MSAAKQAGFSLTNKQSQTISNGSTSRGCNITVAQAAAVKNPHFAITEL